MILKYITMYKLCYRKINTVLAYSTLRILQIDTIISYHIYLL